MKYIRIALQDRLISCNKFTEFVPSIKQYRYIKDPELSEIKSGLQLGGLVMRSITILVILFFCTSNLYAQVRSLKLGIGPELNINWLLPDEAEQKMSIGGGININYSAFPYFGIGVIYGYNELNGMRDEIIPSDYTEQNIILREQITFKTSSWYLRMNMTYNMFPNFKINPFISAGIGLIYFDPKYDNGKPLPNAIAGNYQKWAAMIPISVGVNFFFAEEFSVNLTGEYNITMSDYLDDIKGGSGDKYYSFKLGFSYYFFDKFYILWERNRK